MSMITRLFWSIETQCRIAKATILGLMLTVLYAAMTTNPDGRLVLWQGLFMFTGFTLLYGLFGHYIVAALRRPIDMICLKGKWVTYKLPGSHTVQLRSVLARQQLVIRFDKYMDVAALFVGLQTMDIGGHTIIQHPCGLARCVSSSNSSPCPVEPVLVFRQTWFGVRLLSGLSVTPALAAAIHAAVADAKKTHNLLPSWA